MTSAFDFGQWFLLDLWGTHWPLLCPQNLGAIAVASWLGSWPPALRLCRARLAWRPVLPWGGSCSHHFWESTKRAAEPQDPREIPGSCGGLRGALTRGRLVCSRARSSGLQLARAPLLPPRLPGPGQTDKPPEDQPHLLNTAPGSLVEGSDSAPARPRLGPGL